MTQTLEALKRKTYQIHADEEKKIIQSKINHEFPLWYPFGVTNTST
jgi:hypothetical protein